VSGPPADARAGMHAAPSHIGSLVRVIFFAPSRSTHQPSVEATEAAFATAP